MQRISLRECRAAPIHRMGWSALAYWRRMPPDRGWKRAGRPSAPPPWVECVVETVTDEVRARTVIIMARPGNCVVHHAAHMANRRRSCTPSEQVRVAAGSCGPVRMALPTIGGAHHHDGRRGIGRNLGEDSLASRMPRSAPPGRIRLRGDREFRPHHPRHLRQLIQRADHRRGEAGLKPPASATRNWGMIW